MSAVKTAALWGVAALVALWVLYRLSRGRTTTLSGRASPRLVRMIAVCVVLLGGARGSEALAQPTPGAECATAGTPAALPKAPRPPVDTDAARPKPPTSDAELRQALRKARSWRGRPEPVAARGFAASRAVASRADLTPAEAAALAKTYAGLEAHLTFEKAVKIASTEAGPVHFRPWLKKSAAPRGYDPFEIPKGFTKALDKALKTADAGTWRTESLIRLEVLEAPAGAALLRRGSTAPLKKGDLVDFGRLDLITTAPGAGTLRLSNPLIGELQLPADRALTAWNLHALLSAEAGKAIAGWTKGAAGCDQKSLEKLHQVLPAAQHAVRSALDPAPGPAPLRTLLTLFDE